MICRCCAAPAGFVIQLFGTMRWETCALNCSTARELDNDGEGIEWPNQCERFLRREWSVNRGVPPDNATCIEQALYRPEVPACPEMSMLADSPLCGSGANVFTHYVLYDTPPGPCSPVLVSEFEDAGIGAYEYRSKAGTEIDRTRATRLYFKHHPSPTCYLRAWVRFKVQWWKLAAYEGGSGADYADHTAGTPYWCNQFDEMGPPEWQEALAPYEWEGTGGGLCLADATKSAGDVANRIDSRDGEAWVPPLEVDLDPDGGIYGWSVADYEVKYSFVEGYEPPWPSQQAGCNGFPSPACMPEP